MVKRDRNESLTEVAGSQFLTAPMPRNPDLEAGIRDEGYTVYADWLLAQGSLVGEWIALAAALEKEADARKKTRLDELATELALPADHLATWGTRHGFWTWLRLHMHLEDEYEVRPLVSRIFATPLCAALDELRVGILRWNANYEDVPKVLEEAANHAWAQRLSRLFLGDAGKDIDMAHHVIGEVGVPITNAFPALTWLKLHSGSQEWRDKGETFSFAGLALSKLETLIIETCAMTKKRLQALWDAQLPELTTLELWFGSRDYDSDVEADDLGPLFGAFSKLVHLGIRNQSFTNELLDQLVASELARRLVTLDLSMSTIDDDIAAELATMASYLPSLETLDVRDNFITPAGASRLEDAFDCEVRIGQQDKLTYAEAGDRFVSVHE